MTNAEQINLTKKLHSLIADLELAETSTSDNRAPVKLDQTSVGRLSRMDAMQQQAMANATSQRRKASITMAKAALKRIAHGKFGYCVECGDNISEKRLNHNPAVTTCISCARGQ